MEVCIGCLDNIFNHLNYHTCSKECASPQCHLGEIYKTSYLSLHDLQKACNKIVNKILETQIMVYLRSDMVSHFSIAISLPELVQLRLITPITECYYSNLRNARMSYSRVQFLLMKVQ